jgi:hypothetical protein
MQGAISDETKFIFFLCTLTLVDFASRLAGVNNVGRALIDILDYIKFDRLCACDLKKQMFLR